MSHCLKGVRIRNFFWYVFSRIRTEYGEIRNSGRYALKGENCVKSVHIRRFSGPYSGKMNAGKYGPEKLEIGTLSTQLSLHLS